MANINFGIGSRLRIASLTVVSRAALLCLLASAACAKQESSSPEEKAVPAAAPSDADAEYAKPDAVVDMAASPKAEAGAVAVAQEAGPPAGGEPIDPPTVDMLPEKPIQDEVRAEFQGQGRAASGGTSKRMASKDRAAAPRSRPRKLALGGMDDPLGDDGSGAGVGHSAIPLKTVQPATEATGENYAYVEEQNFTKVADDPQSTFSVDVDTAAYANVRRFLRDGQLPPPDAVRIEEMINYFRYKSANQALNLTASEPVGLIAEVSEAPWNHEHRLVRLALASYEPPQGQRPATNLVFLIDVSGSMNEPDKLPLLQQAFTVLTNQLNADDHVSIVVYAGASGVVLPPTAGDQRGRILAALNDLSAGGSTAGSEGIELAYALAQQNFRPNQVNRVVLATDGDFNVGLTSQGELTRLIEKKREKGIELSVLGFGRGNLQDSTMEMLADKGNGNYAYIDSIEEAKKVLAHELSATLLTVAKDVKLQIEMNPRKVSSYRLIGYDNRRLAHADFNNDRKDAGEIGAGHTVTALYEVIPAKTAPSQHAEPLRYQGERTTTQQADLNELMHVKIRYKRPRETESKLVSFPVHDGQRSFAEASADFRFATAVAGFGMVLKHSPYAGSTTLRDVQSWAQGAIKSSKNPERSEFVELVTRATRLSQPATSMLAH